MLVTYTLFNRSILPFPNSKVINRCVPEANDVVRIAINDVIPPTAAYMPKSVSPKTSRVNLEVYSPIAKTNNCLIYSIIVFLAMRLLLAVLFDIGCYFCLQFLNLF